MARPTKAIVDYFPLDCAFSDSMKIIESKFGNDGFAFWVKLLQKLGRTENHFIDCRNKSKWKLLSAEMLVDEYRCIQILKELAELGCIDFKMWESKIIFSQKFIDGLLDVYKRRNVNLLQKQDICKQLGLSSRVNVIQNPVNDNNNPQSKLNNTKQNETKEKVISSICEFYNRRETTEWSEKEKKKLNEIIKRINVVEELELIMELYNSGFKFYRRDIITLLNNWTGELDKANDNKKQGVKSYGI